MARGNLSSILFSCPTSLLGTHLLLLLLLGIFTLVGGSGRRRRPFHHVDDVWNYLPELASNLRGRTRPLQNIHRPPFPKVLSHSFAVRSFLRATRF